MGIARGNHVEGARGIGILCVDHSMCEIEHNTVAGALVDGDQDPSRQGVAIESYFYARPTCTTTRWSRAPAACARSNSTISSD